MFMRRVHQLAVQTAKRSISIVRFAKSAPKVSFNLINAARFSTEDVENASLSEVLATELQVFEFVLSFGLIFNHYWCN